MKANLNRALCAGVGAILIAWGPGADAVEDGLGTNHAGVLRATALELGGETRSAWQAETDSVGGTNDFRVGGDRLHWAPAFRWSGQLGTLRAQTDGGEADAQVVRSKWNEDWGTYTVVGDIRVTSTGIETGGWASAWVSNGYRIGIVVTNYTTGTNLWWSMDCERTTGL